MTMREEFEAWFRANHCWAPEHDPLAKDGDGDYLMLRTHDLWRAWQASRAALVIQLPERMPAFSGKSDYWDGAHNGFNQCVDTCKVHFEFAGLKVKP